MGKKRIKYKLTRVVYGGRIIVKRISKSDDDNLDQKRYSELEREIGMEWEQLSSAPGHLEKKQKFKIGSHVIVKLDTEPGELPECKRGIVMEQMNMIDKNTLTVFLYDYGIFEDVEVSNVATLQSYHKDELPQRTRIVVLTGIVPASLVIDLAKKMSGDSESAYILKQDYEWSKKTNKRVLEWLEEPNVYYLVVKIHKLNPDSSVYGDIFRKLNSKEEGRRRKKESLSEWLIAEKLALHNDALRCNQLKDSTTDLSGIDPTGLSLPSAVENPSTSNRVPQTLPELYAKQQALLKDMGDLFDPDFNPLSDDSCDEGSSDDDTDTSSDMKKSKGDASTSSASRSGISKTSRERATPNIPDPNIPGQLLLRGHTYAIPYGRLEELNLPKDIFKALGTLGIKELSDFQKLVIPNFIRANDLVIIAPGGIQIGKNARLVTYILPILKLVYNTYCGMKKQELENCSPEAIIVVKSYNTGTAFESFIHSLLSYCPQMPVRVKFLCKELPNSDTSAIATRIFNERKILPKGISVLITTVDYLSAILKTSHGAGLCDNLTFVIFEELELYMKDYWDEIVRFICCLRDNCIITGRTPFQLVFSSTMWCEEMERLYIEKFNGRIPVLIMAAIQQVLRFAKLKWVIHHISATKERIDKYLKINEILQSYGNHRTVIACSSPSVAEMVYEQLKKDNIFIVQLITSKNSQEELKFTRHRWISERASVLVVSDDMIRRSDIKEATCLISYDSPIPQIIDGQRRPILAERFGYLWANIRHIENEGKESEGHYETSVSPMSLCSHFLITGEEYNFYLLYKFIASLNTDVVFPPVLKQKALKMERDGASNLKLCESLKQFGHCKLRNGGECNGRHYFTVAELNVESLVPVSGEIEVRIKKCKNASEYQVQLLRHYVFRGKERICSKSYMDELCLRHQTLKMYYGMDCKTIGDNSETKSKPKETCKLWKEGAFCAVFHPAEKAYTRAQIVSVSSSVNENQVPTNVRVFCIDIGDNLNPRGTEIYELPEEYQKWPPLVVNLVLTNLQPPQGEVEYRQYSERRVKDTLLGKIYHAKIWISVGDTTWVNPMVEYYLESKTNTLCKGGSARMTLITKKLAAYNRSHLDNLNKLLRDHGEIYRGHHFLSQELEPGLVSSYYGDELAILKTECSHSADDYNWAFMDQSSTLSDDNKLFSTCIGAMYGCHPWLFYGVQIKYEKLIIDLERELNVMVNQRIGTARTEDNDDDQAEADNEDDEGNKEMFIDYAKICKDFYKPGMAVCAKERVENKWMRALIIERHDAGELEPQFEIFFVDLGVTEIDMTLAELFPIPTKFVNRLPFQAIAFKLDSIKPFMPETHGSDNTVWGEAAKDVFLDLIVPQGNSQALDVVVIERLTEDSEWIPCRYYSVVAFLRNNNDDLASLMVTQQKASWKVGKENIAHDVRNKFENMTTSSVVSTLNVDEDEDSSDLGGDSAMPNFDTFDVYLGEFEKPINGTIQTQTVRDNEEDPGQQDNQATQSQQQSTTTTFPVPSSSSQAETQLKPNLVNGRPFLHPRILWKQTESNVFLTIALPDIKKYKFHVRSNSRIVQFQTYDMAGGGDYGFEMELFGRVDRTPKEHLTGQRLQVILKKRSEIIWKHILFDVTKKNKWLKEDVDYEKLEEAEWQEMRTDRPRVNSSSESEEEPEVMIEKLKKAVVGVTAVDSDSDVSSSDENM